jgi:phosphoribosyl 1,2-cyclic phosphodiesterase
MLHGVELTGHAVDFFRSHPDLRPPLACFLSHIHSDHLAGLENLRSPLYEPSITHPNQPSLFAF